MYKRLMHKHSTKQFFSRLSYSFGNEDPRVELKALKIKANDRVLCITASGDRPLHLLLENCSEVVSIDLNETQNNLLALKSIAMQHFDYKSYLSFLGGIEDEFRIEKLKKILPHFSEKERHFWNSQEKLISKGILYQGTVEKMCKCIASGLKLFRRKKVQRLFEINDLNQQRAFVKEHWNSFFWRKCFELLVNSPLRFVIKDPGLFAYLSHSISPGKYIYDRLTHSLNSTLASENPFMSLLFRGYVNKEALPPYLSEAGMNTIKPRLNRLSWKTENVITYLENSPPASFDCYSLSDIASYMDKDNFERLLTAILRTAKPGARFSLRQFMSDHSIPKSLTALKRDVSLEKTLEAEDCCFVYRFMAGTIG